VADEIDDVAVHGGLGGAGHADRFVEHDVDVPALALGCGPHFQRLAVHFDLVVVTHLRPDATAEAVHGDPSLGDQAIGFATRAEAAFTDVFVEAHGYGRRRGAA